MDKVLGIESLPKFRNLRHLDIDRPILYKYNMAFINHLSHALVQRLPTSLEHLTLCNDGVYDIREVLSQVGELVNCSEKLQSARIMRFRPPELTQEEAMSFGVPGIYFKVIDCGRMAHKCSSSELAARVQRLKYSEAQQRY